MCSYFKKRRYVFPLILLPCLIFMGYLVIELFFCDYQVCRQRTVVWSETPVFDDRYHLRDSMGCDTVCDSTFIKKGSRPDDLADFAKPGIIQALDTVGGLGMTGFHQFLIDLQALQRDAHSLRVKVDGIKRFMETGWKYGKPFFLAFLVFFFVWALCWMLRLFFFLLSGIYDCLRSICESICGDNCCCRCGSRKRKREHSSPVPATWRRYGRERCVVDIRPSSDDDGCMVDGVRPFGCAD